ncbi:hypothetical protein K491DRAFT_314782 [Lophiostoma macrostomum CBS 122681]|uniref:Uncharacterized protein n=1 Tax=Lophiostoma macrostomum CBS 122681 TaxID=1314788 RepID=A0A6A6TDD9_9PLEO|nr:hypothetical protein K491DRAFT_314782 [Lophiostoma macrostomum CBS 122681]
MSMPSASSSFWMVLLPASRSRMLGSSSSTELSEERSGREGSMRDMMSSLSVTIDGPGRVTVGDTAAVLRAGWRTERREGAELSMLTSGVAAAPTVFLRLDVGVGEPRSSPRWKSSSSSSSSLVVESSMMGAFFFALRARFLKAGVRGISASAPASAFAAAVIAFSVGITVPTASSGWGWPPLSAPPAALIPTLPAPALAPAFTAPTDVLLPALPGVPTPAPSPNSRRRAGVLGSPIGLLPRLPWISGAPRCALKHGWQTW